MEEQVEESKEPEKPETKIPEEEEPTRTEEDREVQRILLMGELKEKCLMIWESLVVKFFFFCGNTNVDVSLYWTNQICSCYWEAGITFYSFVSLFNIIKPFKK